MDAAHEIFYIGDNAGECVFDRILIEEMKKPVTYAVRDAPIINDATYKDAVDAGIDRSRPSSPPERMPLEPF